MKKILVFIFVFAMLALSGCQSQYDEGYDDGYDEGYYDGYYDCYDELLAEYQEMEEELQHAYELYHIVDWLLAQENMKSYLLETEGNLDHFPGEDFWEQMYFNKYGEEVPK